ncbi:NACHT domain-containing protein [Nocardioides sp. NPDC057772]|uniref:NACHT domain-containing protein n=1 Tax=Nocardioides sp. NPDC057772 TaxID=3346245 RepID=UPI00366CACE0
MVRFDLERLGPVGFQDLAAALAIKALGAHVHAMGRGRDGGRDMLCEGTIDWSNSDQSGTGERWDGRTVFQAKHKDTLTSPRQDATWVWSQIKSELDEWASPTSTRGEAPNYLVFITNVPLTPTQDSGGYDTIERNITDWLARVRDNADQGVSSAERRNRMRSLRTWRVWDGNHINALLTAHSEVRRAFDAFLTAGDVLAGLSTNVSAGELGAVLGEHARYALINDLPILTSSAARETARSSAATDRPGASEYIISSVMERGEHLLKPSLTIARKPRHLVIVGAPGNGKTTLSKFLTHAYRATFVTGSVDLGDEHQSAVGAAEEALATLACPAPANRRWPMRVDLAEFAVEQASNSDYTLMHWIAKRITAHVGGKDVPRWALWPWLQAWPSFLILDGLDEVTEPAVRRTVIDHVQAFAADAESKDCDMLIVVTTRPTGYADDMPASMFERIDLADLTVDDALAYGKKVASVRIRNDSTRRERVVALLEEAAADTTLRRLMRTPLQVLIMSIIAESAGRFSPSRYALFWGYYQTIEQREQRKSMGQSRLIREHAQEVLDLHRRAGLHLQRLAETSYGAESVLAPDDLREITWQVLQDAGYDPAGKGRRLLDDLMAASTTRLVLLAPKPEGGFGFDVRSLQELMAALALTTGPFDEVEPRLRQIAASPHWRNTLLFATGRYFATPQPHEQTAITDLVIGIDEAAPERLGSVVKVGPQLALEILDDGMATKPVHVNRLLDHALTILNGPPPADLPGFVATLVRIAAASEDARTRIADGIRTALSGSQQARRTTEQVQDTIGSFVNVDNEESANIWVLHAIQRDPARPIQPDPHADWETFWETVSAYADDTNNAALEHFGILMQDLASGVNALMPGLKWTEELHGTLRDPDMALILDEALGPVAEGSPLLVETLRDNVLPPIWRERVFDDRA